ncbi:hypothetical protein PDJAM_G00024970 [Pangasius djambal]|uniref:Uncharacterized protein n=1 Tax=Pangasius djambal TaxID=1691987 RepID=A0ACC5YNY6_9TELE|nr:hypothetical protein [Pangasius djambal]
MLEINCTVPAHWILKKRHTRLRGLTEENAPWLVPLTITISFIFGSECFRSTTHSAGNASCAAVFLLGRHREDHFDVPNTRALNTLHPEHDRKEYARHHKKSALTRCSSLLVSCVKGSVAIFGYLAV